MEKISLVIPAFNEEKQIGFVIAAARKSSLLSEIIVVDDGSVDKTAEIVRKSGVKLIELKPNQGKATAMARGLAAAKEDIVLFLDADLINLTENHIQTLVEPLFLNQNLSMSLGVFRKSGFVTFFGNGIFVHLSGQRALRKKHFEKLILEGRGFGAELAISKFVWRNLLRYKKVPLYNLQYVIKEQKVGFWAGVKYRFKMYKEVLEELIRKD